jgi:hypothetical protein
MTAQRVDRHARILMPTPSPSSSGLSRRRSAYFFTAAYRLPTASQSMTLKKAAT